MNLDNTVITSLNKKYSPSTMKQVKCCYRRVAKLMTKVESPKDLLRNNTEDLQTALDKIPITSRSTCTAYILAIIKVENEVPDNLQQYATKQRNDCRSEHIKNRQTKKINKDLDCSKLKEFFIANNNKRTKRKPFSVQKSNRAVLFSLLNDMPVRLSEFADMGFNNESSNYIDIDNKQMIIRKHKTGKSKRVIDLSDDTIELIKTHKENTNSAYLFHQGLDNSKPMKGSNLEELYRNAVKSYCNTSGVEYVPKQSGIHSLRSNKECKNLEPLLKNTVTEKEMLEIVDTCKKMGHSLETAIVNYFRNQ